jgi:hypothetical protein
MAGFTAKSDSAGICDSAVFRAARVSCSIFFRK